MRVLFVDDEPAVLQGLERMLYQLADEWEMVFVESGARALEELERAPFDVLVTDVRMPGMDGAELLQIVHRRFPEVVRIVLSGHAELEAALRTIPVAHQFLNKPCRADLLESAVVRALGLRRLLEDGPVRSVVGGISDLPSVPAIYRRLTAALADLNTGADEVAEIVGEDPAMCAKVLHLVNSAFFLRGERCVDVRQGVLRLGMQMIKNLALSVAVFRSWPSTAQVDGFSIDAVQRDAVRSAALVRAMLPDKRQAEDAVMAAMLHDVGLLILAAEWPDNLQRAVNASRAGEIPLFEAEREVLGTTHAEVGAYLLGLWGLPYPVVEAVANHHHPRRVPNRTGFGVLEAVYVADCLIKREEPDLELLAERGAMDRLDSWREQAA